MNSSRTGATASRAAGAEAARRPWAALHAVLAVVLGPAAATASALDQANAAPPHRAARAGRTRAHRPPAAPRGRAAA
ncbi:hypothetical protein ACIBAI_08765 [Streptomyces sp. NPDC051041]|uniref:hypothetical protein n=1 Tax=Streptomyces sp. NPDC051041 TaxID=3365640 RepID=UPI0037BAD230